LAASLCGIPPKDVSWCHSARAGGGAPSPRKAVTLYLLAGGTRSGKTFLIVRSIVACALKAPGSRHAILRFHANAARASIALDTLPNVAKLCFPALKLKQHR